MFGEKNGEKYTDWAQNPQKEQKEQAERNTKYIGDKIAGICLNRTKNKKIYNIKIYFFPSFYLNSN